MVSTEPDVPVIRYNPQAKFQWWPGAPQQAPHRCANCGNGNIDKFLDWHLDIEFYGKVVFCPLCFTEAANQLGYASPEQWERVINTLHMYAETIEDLRSENEELRNALASFNSVFARGSTTDSLSSLPSIETRESIQNPPVHDENSNSDESESHGQDTKQGSSNVSVDDSISSFITGLDI